MLSPIIEGIVIAGLFNVSMFEKQVITNMVSSTKNVLKLVECVCDLFFFLNVFCFEYFCRC